MTEPVGVTSSTEPTRTQHKKRSTGPEVGERAVEPTQAGPSASLRDDPPSKRAKVLPSAAREPDDRAPRVSRSEVEGASAADDAMDESNEEEKERPTGRSRTAQQIFRQHGITIYRWYKKREEKKGPRRSISPPRLRIEEARYQPLVCTSYTEFERQRHLPEHKQRVIPIALQGLYNPGKTRKERLDNIKKYNKHLPPFDVEKQTSPLFRLTFRFIPLPVSLCWEIVNAMPVFERIMDLLPLENVPVHIVFDFDRAFKLSASSDAKSAISITPNSLQDDGRLFRASWMSLFAECFAKDFGRAPDCRVKLWLTTCVPGKKFSLHLHINSEGFQSLAMFSAWLEQSMVPFVCDRAQRHDKRALDVGQWIEHETKDGEKTRVFRCDVDVGAAHTRQPFRLAGQRKPDKGKPNSRPILEEERQADGRVLTDGERFWRSLTTYSIVHPDRLCQWAIRGKRKSKPKATEGKEKEQAAKQQEKDDDDGDDDDEQKQRQRAYIESLSGQLQPFIDAKLTPPTFHFEKMACSKRGVWFVPFDDGTVCYYLRRAHQHPFNHGWVLLDFNDGVGVLGCTNCEPITKKKHRFRLAAGSPQPVVDESQEEDDAAEERKAETKRQVTKSQPKPKSAQSSPPPHSVAAAGGAAPYAAVKTEREPAVKKEEERAMVNVLQPRQQEQHDHENMQEAHEADQDDDFEMHAEEDRDPCADIEPPTFAAECSDQTLKRLQDVVLAEHQQRRDWMKEAYQRLKRQRPALSATELSKNVRHQWLETQLKPALLETVNQSLMVINKVSQPLFLEEYREHENDSPAYVARTRTQLLETFGDHWHIPVAVIQGQKKPIVYMNMIKEWLAYANRRSYDKLEFDLNPQVSPRVYNLFLGFAITKEKATAWMQQHPDWKDRLMPTLRHVCKIWCRSQERSSRFVCSWLAHAMQKPEIKPRTALVVGGSEGAGKDAIMNKTAQIIGSEHYKVTTRGAGIKGAFNGELLKCFMMQYNEAHFAYDKDAQEGTLKAYVTDPIKEINAKFKEPIQVKCFMRVIIFSNILREILKASASNRRYLFLKTDDRYAGKQTAESKKYFDELWSAPAEAWAYFLYHLDITDVNVSEIWCTELEREHKEAQMPVYADWWKECLDCGYIFWDQPNPTGPADDRSEPRDWPAYVEKKTLQDSFSQYGGDSKQTKTFWANLQRYINGDGKKWEYYGKGKNQRVKLPSLAECRDRFRECWHDQGIRFRDEGERTDAANKPDEPVTKISFRLYNGDTIDVDLAADDDDKAKDKEQSGRATDDDDKEKKKQQPPSKPHHRGQEGEVKQDGRGSNGGGPGGGRKRAADQKHSRAATGPPQKKNHAKKGEWLESQDIYAYMLQLEKARWLDSTQVVCCNPHVWSAYLGGDSFEIGLDLVMNVRDELDACRSRCILWGVGDAWGSWVEPAAAPNAANTLDDAKAKEKPAMAAAAAAADTKDHDQTTTTTSEDAWDWDADTMDVEAWAMELEPDDGEQGEEHEDPPEHENKKKTASKRRIHNRHWAVVGYNAYEKCFVYMDSLPGEAMRSAVHKLVDALRAALVDVLDEDVEVVRNAPLKTLSCPKQQDGWSCGFFSMSAMSVITECVRRGFTSCRQWEQALAAVDQPFVNRVIDWLLMDNQGAVPSLREAVDSAMDDGRKKTKS